MLDFDVHATIVPCLHQSFEWVRQGIKIQTTVRAVTVSSALSCWNFMLISQVINALKKVIPHFNMFPRLTEYTPLRFWLTCQQARPSIIRHYYSSRKSLQCTSYKTRPFIKCRNEYEILKCIWNLNMNYCHYMNSLLFKKNFTVY